MLADRDEFRILQTILALFPITLNGLDAPITVIGDRLLGVVESTQSRMADRVTPGSQNRASATSFVSSKRMLMVPRETHPIEPVHVSVVESAQLLAA